MYVLNNISNPLPSFIKVAKFVVTLSDEIFETSETYRALGSGRIFGRIFINGHEIERCERN